MIRKKTKKLTPKKPSKIQTARLKEAPLPVPKNREDFFVVCIGASAGGLEAFRDFLKHTPENSGMAYVFVQHLSPKHKSLLPEILARFTNIPVLSATNGMVVKKNFVYVIPPDATMYYEKGKLILKKRETKDKPHHPIDRFMESMALELGPRAIGVVLSGTGSDGAEGTRIIKSEGGLSFAQSPNSAAYGSMPTKAITSDDIDFILDPKAIALEIANLGKMPRVHRIESKVNEVPKDEINDFTKIMLMLKQYAGTDFSQYKPTTIRRRIARRMLLHKLETLGDYFKYLQKNPAERAALNSDVLINVTTFFREPETYEYLKKTVIPTIMKHKPAGQPLRIWSAGCSTGEETYSLAITVLEVLGAEANPTSVQIFATDLSDRCIEKARLGKYFDNITEHISQDMINKYFTKTDQGFRIAKHVRDLCIFAKHDLTRDPAYSKLDIISCKNLMIYLGNDLQTKVLENFHYSLNPGGYLCLGNSESVGKSTDLFTIVDTKLKVYVKKNVTSRLPVPNHSPRREYLTMETLQHKKSDAVSPTPFEIQTETDRAILARYSPPSVVVNSKNEIIQFRGNTEQYLTHKQGEATLNIFKMAREGLSNELKNALAKARQKDSSERMENVMIHGFGPVNFEIIPLKFLPGDRCHLVVFEPNLVTPSLLIPGKKAKRGGRIKEKEYESILVAQLKQELNTVKDNLQAVIQDFENANQELQSANEEVLSSNEELQSTNEELETSKEELQSANEELSTVNDELQERNQELFGLNNDLVNVLNSVHLPILIVGNDLNIRRYTPSSSKIFNLIPTDIGRPFAHISSNVVQVSEVGEMIQEVLDNAVIKEKELQSKDGKWYLLRVRPYKTEEQRIEGAVITLQETSDITSFVEITSELIDVVKTPLIVLDRELKIRASNQAFRNVMDLKLKNYENRMILDVTGKTTGTKFKSMLQSFLKSTKHSVTEKMVWTLPKKGKKSFNITLKKLTKDRITPTQMLITFEEP